MTCQLAQATPNAGAFMQFWLIIGFISTILVNIVTIVVLIINRKQRREVSYAFEPASKEAFEKHVADNAQEHRDMFSKIGGVERGAGARLENQINEMRRERRADNAELHEKINGVSIKVGGLEKTAELQNQTLAQMNAKLDRVTERK